jgi:hypothetical protein
LAGLSVRAIAVALSDVRYWHKGDVGQRLNPLAPEAIPGHFRLARLTRYDALSETESVQ